MEGEGGENGISRRQGMGMGMGMGKGPQDWLKVIDNYHYGMLPLSLHVCTQTRRLIKTRTATTSAFSHTCRMEWTIGCGREQQIQSAHVCTVTVAFQSDPVCSRDSPSLQCHR